MLVPAPAKRYPESDPTLIQGINSARRYVATERLNDKAYADAATLAKAYADSVVVATADDSHFDVDVAVVQQFQNTESVVLWHEQIKRLTPKDQYKPGEQCASSPD